MESTSSKAYNPKLSPGIHAKDLQELFDLAVKDYPEGGRRETLWKGFLVLYRRMLAADLHGLELWVDGSFLTDKPEPSDIDCVLWVPEEHIDQCTDDQYQKLIELKDVAAIRGKYLTHLHIAPAGDRDNIEYWERWFGQGRRPGESKGFVRIEL